MVRKGIEIGDAEQEVDNAGVADINFWRFDDAFASVGVEWRQAPDEEQVRWSV